MQVMRTILLFSVVIGFSSCAHKNLYNHEACAASYGPISIFPLQIVGFVLQQGECSFYRPLKIELGAIYHAQKKQLLFAVDSGGGSEIDKFAEILRCEKDSIPIFKKTLLANKSEIFGENYKKSDRRIMINIYEMIKKDEQLKSCDFN